MKRLIPAVVILILAGPVRGFPQDFNAPEAPDVLAARILGQMTDEQALAQTFMLGWVGAEPSPLIVDWIRDRNIGGIKIFGWNTGDTLRLAETVGLLQKAALQGELGIPLFIATDQEGGWIRHVKGATSETPGNMAIGASGYPRDAYLSGYYIGRELAILGINMNFAPAVDLYTNRDSTLIGPRAFGSDPIQAGILGAAFVKGQAAAGIIATAKHFPGHGDTDLDSHGVLPQIDASFEVLWDRELVPYRILSKENIPAIMSGHLAFPNILDESTSASLSPWFLKDILRDRIGYKGLVITDDLLMNGATMSAGNVSRAAKQALLAGNDIIMLSKTPSLDEPVWTALAAAMKQEPEFRARVRDAALRILTAKLTYLRGERAAPYVPDLRKVESGLPDPEGAAFFLDLAARSVTVVKGAAGETAVPPPAFNSNPAPGNNPPSGGLTVPVIPLSPGQAGKVLLAGQFEDFFTAGKKAYPGASSYRYSSGREGELARYARSVDTVIFCLSDAAGLNQLRALRSLGKRIIVFSVLSPVYLDEVSWADGAIAVYSYAPESFLAGFSVLLGRIPGRGRLPFQG